MSLQKTFLREFTLSLMDSAKSRPAQRARVDMINSDLVPRMSDHTIMNNVLIEKKIIPPVKLSLEIQPEEVKPLQVQTLQTQTIQAASPKAPVLPSQVPIPKKVMPAPINFPVSSGEFGRITGLLADNTITLIECGGEGKNIYIVRAGQRQLTNITLNPAEIKEILERIALKARVPLIEGVFMAAVDNFTINAVISSSIGSRFVIRKQTPYSLLEVNRY